MTRLTIPCRRVLAATLLSTVAACVGDSLERSLDPQFSGPRQSVTSGDPSEPMIRPGRLTWAGPSRNFLLVTDHYRGVVYEFKVKHGELVPFREFQFDAGVSGIAWGGDRFFVGNTTTASVAAYRQNGTWMYDLGGPGTFEYPSDIEVDEERDLVFVLDNRRQSIDVFGVNGEPKNTWSASALGMENPVALGIDTVRQELLVSDYGGLGTGSGPFAIHVFDYEGNRLKLISGKLGMLGARFSRPQGTTVDAQGRILMVDALSCELFVIDRESGAVLDIFGEPGTEPGQMLAPLDVAVDADGRAFVTSNRLGRIEVFDVGGGS